MQLRHEIVCAFEATATLRDDGWYPGVKQTVNGVFFCWTEWDIPMDDEKTALMLARTLRSEVIEMHNRTVGTWLSKYE